MAVQVKGITTLTANLKSIAEIIPSGDLVDALETLKDFNTGGISTENARVFSRDRYGTPGSPKSDLHHRTLFDGF